jgi:S1-C subfamily serine protease
VLEKANKDLLKEVISPEAFALTIAISELESDAEISNKRLLKGPSQFDSRIELKQLDPLIDWQQRILLNAKSVGLVIRKDNLVRNTDTTMRVGTGLTLGKKYNLCSDQAFAEQPVAGEGTAFVINDLAFMSASHVFKDPLDRYAIVFGFEIINTFGAFAIDIPNDNIFYPTSITYRDEALDLVVVGVDRQVSRPALSLSIKGISEGDEVYALGYPSGLPMKLLLNANIVTNDDLQSFYTSLDAFQGNSGSPVFNLDTQEVIGVLVSGESDYRWNGSCNVTTLCRFPYCKGEKVIKISQFLNRD